MSCQNFKSSATCIHINLLSTINFIHTAIDPSSTVWDALFYLVLERKMTVSGGSANGYRTLTVETALELARTSEGNVEPAISNILERAVRDLWARIQAQPHTYLLSRSEFSLFNYFRSRFGSSEVAQRAIKRFWDNFQGDPNDVL